MTYYGGKEMAAGFRTVRKNTIKIAKEIPEEKYDFKPANESGASRKTLAHIALAPASPGRCTRTRFTDLKKVNFPELMAKIAADQAKTRTKAEIIELLKTEGEPSRAISKACPSRSSPKRSR